MILALMVVMGLLLELHEDAHGGHTKVEPRGIGIDNDMSALENINLRRNVNKKERAIPPDSQAPVSIDWKPGQASSLEGTSRMVDSSTGSSRSISGIINDNEKKDPEPTPGPTPGPTKGWQMRQWQEDQKEFAMRKKEPRIDIQESYLGRKRKSELKQDKMVRLYEEDILPEGRNVSAEPTYILGQTRSFFEAQNRLKMHPLYGLLYLVPGSSKSDSQYIMSGDSNSLTEAMVKLYDDPQCDNTPLYLTMASVGDELYWQLIENFIYSLVKFDLSSCGMVICVSDEKCMELCADSYFPCFNYRSPPPLPSVMEQIGTLKLLHIPKVLAQGVDLFMLDLDVGFLNDPRHMTKVFYETPTIDIFVQLDYLFIMNRSTAGWKQWFTEPLPNIGLFLCRGNNKTKRVFDHAWHKYETMPDIKAKKNPGKDQNHVLDGMRIGRGMFGLRFAYFKNNTAALLDKVVQKWRGIELGGLPVAQFTEQQKTIAVHTTCYEQRTKVMGLKAVNGFWNPRYYDHLRPTLTKQILYISEAQVRDEVRSLVWLAMATKRSFIAPNLLGGPEKVDISPTHLGHAMWPGFRVAYLKRESGRMHYGNRNSKMVKNVLDVEILEPAYYWRVERDYDPAPDPVVVYIYPHDTLVDVRDRIMALDTSNHANSRVVLHYTTQQPSSAVMEGEVQDKDIDRVVQWAKCSVGEYHDTYAVEHERYGSVPSVKKIRSEKNVPLVLTGMRTCKDVFAKLRGNRTCFQVCD